MCGCCRAFALSDPLLGERAWIATGAPRIWLHHVSINCNLIIRHGTKLLIRTRRCFSGRRLFSWQRGVDMLFRQH